MRLSTTRTLLAAGILALSCAACSKSDSNGSSGSPTSPSSPSIPSGSTSASCAQVYVPSAGATGSITGDQNDCRGWVDTPGAQFTMTLTEQTNLDFTLETPGYNGTLALYTEANVRIDQVPSGAHIVALLPAGTYHISVGSIDKGGRYTLRSAPVTALAASCESPYSPSAVVGATFSATHTSTVCVTTVRLPGVAVGQKLTFTVLPDKAMTFVLNVGNATTPLLQQTMPKDVPTTVTYTVPTAGDYRLGVYWGPGVTPPINYTLSFR